MYMTICRGCASRLSLKYRTVEVEDSEQVGAVCRLCHQWYPSVSQYWVAQPRKERRRAEGPAKKDTRARYREPWRTGMEE